MNELQIFNYNGNEVRTIEKDGEPWWVLKDVCGVLGLKNPTVIADRLEEDEVTKFNLGGLSGETNIINESGLYNVILRSDKPEAKPFRKWVTSEVLPSIRKTGSYSKPKTQAEILLGQAQMLVDLERQQREQQKAIEDTNKRIDSIKDVVALDSNYWRKDTNKLVLKMALKAGGCSCAQAVRDESYKLLESRMGVNLKTRLTNKRKNLALNGVCKSAIQKVNYLDVIGEDKKLIEGYTAIVKEMAIKYGICD